MVKHKNPQALYLHVVGTAGMVPLGLLLSIPTGVPQYWGWGSLVAALGIAFLANIGISFVLFWSVDIEPGVVVLRSLFRRVVVRAAEVNGIELDPAVNTTSLDWSWRERQSLLTIHRKGKARIRTGAMPEGMKLLIAHALDPLRFPLPASVT